MKWVCFYSKLCKYHPLHLFSPLDFLPQRERGLLFQRWTWGCYPVGRKHLLQHCTWASEQLCVEKWSSRMSFLSSSKNIHSSTQWSFSSRCLVSKQLNKQMLIQLDNISTLFTRLTHIHCFSLVPHSCLWCYSSFC